MKRAVLMTGLVAVIAGAASATPLSVAAAALGATYHSGTRAATAIYGTALSYDGDSGTMLNPTVDYSYSLDGFVVNTAYGNASDNHWLQDVGTRDAAGGTKISFGSIYSTEFFLDPCIDHEPLGNESLETTLYGSNDGGATWILGSLTDVYEQGWNASTITDDGSSRWTFSVAVNLISSVWGLTQGTYDYADGDDEVDAVSINRDGVVPLPSASLMGFAGLTTIGAIRRRRTV